MEYGGSEEIDLSADHPGLPLGLVKSHCLDKHAGQKLKAHSSLVQSDDSVILWGGRIPDFLGVDGRRAVEILRWPESFVDLAVALLPRVSGCGRAKDEQLSELNAFGLTGDDGILTPLGHKLAYHLDEYNIQADPAEECDFTECLEIGRGSRILDIGCGAGQTLFRLQRFDPAECAGLDRDIENLAWGCRLQPRFCGNPVGFICASGENIPFVDDRFTHVLSRVALNYMHLDRALKEAVRVLKPGGLLSIRAINVGYYLNLLRKTRNMRRIAANTYKLGWGCVAAFTGFQVHPRRKWAAKEIFSPLFRLRKILSDAGCEITHWKHNGSCLGIPVTTSIVAAKKPNR
jgi:ubiquinone/menaquinone biosynthesis C-methylase UbiE